MEYTAISRRAHWICAGAVDVAPDWPLGTMLPYRFYFMSEHYLLLYLRITVGMPHGNAKSGIVRKIPWLQDLCDETVTAVMWLMKVFDENMTWDNYRYSYNRKRNWFRIFKPSYWSKSRLSADDASTYYTYRYTSFVTSIVREYW